jgi:hypothetical protein
MEVLAMARGRKHNGNTERLCVLVEPELRSFIEGEASRLRVEMSHVVRTMLRQQVAATGACAHPQVSAQ